MRTIITKTRAAIRETQTFLMSPLEKMSKKENRFYESFVKDDMRQLEAELFPADQIHIGELNPIIGRRIHN